MQSKHWTVRIQHILASIDKLQRYTAGLTFEEFSASQLTVDAVVRNVEVIGEASRRVPDDVIARYGEIPWSTLRSFPAGLPNRCVDARLDAIWDAIHKVLPALIPHLTAIHANEA